MFSILRQTTVIARVNLRGLRHRVAISLSMAFSVALAVCVLVGFLSMATGFETTLASSGAPLVAVVLGGGTNQETGSEIPADAIRALQAMQADIGANRDGAGNLVLSREFVQPVAFQDPKDGTARSLALRGMDPSGLILREEIKLSQGQLFTSGRREIVVGARLAQDIPGFGIGDTVRMGALDWLVVGHFTANGSVFESEIWADLEAAGVAFDRQGQVQTLRLRLSAPDSLDRLTAAVAGIATAPLLVMSEAKLYAGQSSRTADLIRLFGWPIALLMAFGATIGALNTMMSAVSDRSVEIATVRSLGFSRLAAFAATWIEAVLIAALGTTLGLVASWMVFNGWQASTLGANNTRMAFQLLVTGEVLATAAMLGLMIGIAGGILPAVSAARVPLAVALRTKA